ncbi:MAG: HAD-IIIA family hydrolase [Oscillospiraceae bacterium]|nr:HAD-IIIA family hydrolase [Oscillospiraceae bacterium]
MQYSLYLFDFDYTLANAETAIVKCYRTVILRYGHPDVPDDLIKRGIGRGINEIFKTLTGVEDEAVLNQYSDEYMREADIYMANETFLYPSVIPVITELKRRGKKLGIISNKLRRRIMETLHKNDIADFFDIVIGSADVANLKPAPDGILKAIAELGVGIDDAVYIGDSPTDAQTAQNAGVAFAAVTTGATTADELRAFPHVAVIADLAELL